MERSELQRAIEAILFAAGECVEIKHLAFVFDVSEAEVVDAVSSLSDELAFNRRGIRIIKLENGYQMVY